MRFKSIDALRGIAALSVVCFHILNRFYIHAESLPPSVPHEAFILDAYRLISIGSLGVDLFFVLSGFCIHFPQGKKFHATGSDNLDLKKFAARRFWRIYPAYFASLVWTSLALLVLPALNYLVHHKHFDFFAKADIRGFFINALFLQQLNPNAPAFNGVYWTIVFEVQFYAFYPCLLWICRKSNFSLVLVALLGVELALIRTPIPIPLFFLSRYFEWFLGMYLAEKLARKPQFKVPAILFPLLFGLGLASVFYAPTRPYRDVIASGAFFVLLAICLARDTTSVWLTPAWLVTLGAFSYSLYLTHIPVIDLFWHFTDLAKQFFPAIPLSISLLSVPASVWFAWMFYCRFEKPYIDKRKTQPKAVASPSQGW